MQKYMNNLRLFLFCGFATLILSACGGASGGSSGTSTGTLTTSLTDSSTEDYRAIYVTVARVDVHPASGDWQTVATPGGTYDLLSLVNGVREELGISTLNAGHYTQMRLIIGATAETPATNILNQAHPFANYLIDQSNVIHELKIPSGFNSGFKIVHGFDISDNLTTELLLDFDAMKSVVKAGASGKYLLKPTIKVLSTLDAALVAGLVNDGSNGIEGALVSAQTYTNDLALDAAQRVNVARSTIAAADDSNTVADEAGKYSLALPAGNYNLVAYFTGYRPLCAAVNLLVATPTTQNFTLSGAATGTISGTVSVTNASVDQHVTIDFRQAGHCPDLNAMINVKTVEIADQGTYSVELPIGTYQVVASSSGVTSLMTNVNVAQNLTSSHNIAF